MMATETLVVKRIMVERGGPPLDQTTVASLMESMGRIGLLNPITVWRPTGSTPTLIAGRHRLEAAKRLGWDEISCIVLDGMERDPQSAIAAQIAFVDENLARRNIGDAERALLVSRRKALYETQHPETVHGGNLEGGGVAKLARPDVSRFTAATARATGRSERAVQRDAQRGEVLGADAARIARTSLDKGVEIDALVALPKRQRASLIDRASRGETVSARAIAARKSREESDGPSPLVHKVLALWEKATPAEKRAIRRFIDAEEQWLPKVLAMWEEGTEADRRKFMAAIMEYA